MTLESDAEWGIRKETSHLANGTPKDLEQWQSFVAMVVERYDGDGQDDAPGLMRPVRYFQVANAWISPTNKAGVWGGSTEQLIHFINASYDATKARSPEAIFVLGGIASGNFDGLVVNEGYASYDI